MSVPSFLRRFEQQVDADPALIAVTFGPRSLSYAEIDHQANRLAHHLIEKGVAPDSVVAICCKRSPEMVIALLAVLKAGAGYLPLDPHYPSARLSFMLEDSRARILVRDRGLSVELPPGVAADLEIDVDHPLLRGGVASRPAHRHTGESLAYAIYTSGSTGQPKGVAMVHRALDNLIDWQLGDSAAGVATATLQFAPLSFDVHFQEIFSTLCSGGRLVLVHEELRLEMLRLIDLIDAEHVERIFLPFIALQSLADISTSHDRIPASLREVITAGEQLQVTRAIRDLFARVPAAALYNHYGPSETHVVTALRLEGEPASWPALPSIGRALPRVTLRILREDRTAASRDEEGELWVGGIALARGYLFRPELTDARFVEHEGARFYRTGDVVKELADGSIQFLGRLDGQVKVRGFRIELGEVEVALADDASVKEAAVSVHENGPADKRLVAYVVLQGGGNVPAVRTSLAKRLPEYMVPSAFVVLSMLPRTPSGKVDKRALPVPDRTRPALSSEYSPPSTDFERQLVSIWNRVLLLEGIGTHDNFFELGGSSLLAIRAIAATEGQFGKALPVARFFEHPTVAAQANYLTDPIGFATGRVRRVVQRRSGAERGPIAVIGMAGRFPGASSVAGLWQNLRNGVDSVEVFAKDSLSEVPLAERDDAAYVAARGIIVDADRFDGAFFGVSPAEADVLDPQQRVLLEVAWCALENAGYAPNDVGSVVGVYAGVHNNTYFTERVQRRPDAVNRVGAFMTMVASEKDYVATRIASKLCLNGPALSIQTACSTSLVAIATAVQQLRAGLCEVALAGGAAVTVPERSGHLYQEGGMLSRDGRTRTFDADASGTVFSDGAAMVVLKPLDRAMADRDTIYAVIRGVGINNDGGEKASFTAPSVEGQAAVIAMAQDDAGLSARDIHYVEAHGTATPLGDPIEVDALIQAFRRGTSDEAFCGIGSIKSNLGHMTAAAGVAGVIKVALSLAHEELPPLVHYRHPNPRIAFEGSPFFVVADRTPWPRVSQLPRRAAVSSFGVGGTNAHVVLEEAPLPEVSGGSVAPQLLVLSAKTPQACDRASRALADHLDAAPETVLADAAYTLATGRAHFAERSAVVVRTPAEAAQKLRQAALASSGRRAEAPPPTLAFLFPGQGAQYVGMGRNLYEGDARFRVTVDECADILSPLLRCDLRELLYPSESSAEEARTALKRTEITQVALFTIEYALAKTLMAWGLEPKALCGHSVGEFVAACVAGIFDLKGALELVAARGRLMQEMPPGAMLGVRAAADTIRAFLPADLDRAADNAPGFCVVAGPSADVARFAEELARREILGKLLETSHAFHSRSMDAAVTRFAQVVRGVTMGRAVIPIVSTATGTWLTEREAQDVDYWAGHLRRTVRFSAALATLREDASRLLLEVGPRKTLTTFALQQAPGDTRPRCTAIASLSDRAEDDSEWEALLTALGRLWVSGIAVDFRALYRGETRRRIGLPTYSFERDRHWLEPPSAAIPVSIVAPARTNELAPAPPANEVSRMTATKPDAAPRRQRLLQELRDLFERTSGGDFQNASPSAHFLELGIDSLLVTQLAIRLKQAFRVSVTFRQLMEETPTLDALASYLDEQLPAEPEPLAAPAPPPAVGAPSAGAPASTMQQVLQLQMAQLALLQQQVALLLPERLQGQAGSVAMVPKVAPSPIEEHLPAAAAKPPDNKVTYDPTKAFGAIARIYKQSDALSPRQQTRLSQLVERYCEKTKTSKAHTQAHRAHHADPRVVNGFKPRIKELIYPIVTARASGCRLWDLDGNEYVDALNGFGSNFFGYSAKIITDAIRERLDQGFEIGPQTPLAGESAALVCELTGMDRAAFCNTGSEAVMGAMRIARTVTGRSLIVAFSGSYHGIFDEVIVRDTKTMRSVPAAPGILPEAVQNILILEYGTDATLAVIRERADEIAAVLVEPVQSRRPDFQPAAFLRQVREITSGSGTALIFDEVSTGIRTHPGGAQAHFGIVADLAIYGKVVGGGMPIGVIAGRNPWMDALDGGFWQYGDLSIPTAGVTYFAGTFVRHPIAMAAAHAALRFMKAEGPALQQRLNEATARMAAELNAFFVSVAAPLEIRYFASLWKTFFLEPQPYGDLLFCYLRDRGVHIWDGFPCFLTLAHGEPEVRFIVDAFKGAVREMQGGDFLPGGPSDARNFDAKKPPVPDARLGRDVYGNPAVVRSKSRSAREVPANILTARFASLRCVGSI